jgi:hypothetical protein
MTIKLPGLLGVALLLACPERGRITGPGGSNGIGPEVTITDPAQDVTMTAGTSILVKGVAFDEEGVDSIYLGNVGGNGELVVQSAGGVPRATFTIPVDLVGAVGDTVTITVYAANLEHVRGDLVTRRIRLR